VLRVVVRDRAGRRYTARRTVALRR
jgi:hypothetical protein